MQVCRLSAGLASAGLQAGDKVAVFASNCPEWMLVLQVGSGKSTCVWGGVGGVGVGVSGGDEMGIYT